MKFLWLLILVAICSCTSQDTHQTISYKHRVFVHSDSCILGKPNQIALSGSYLAITDLNNDKVLYVFNSQSGKKVGEYVNRGQGPGEYYSISSLGRWKNGMYLYDVNKREMAERNDRERYEEDTNYSTLYERHHEFAKMQAARERKAARPQGEKREFRGEKRDFRGGKPAGDKRSQRAQRFAGNNKSNFKPRRRNED